MQLLIEPCVFLYDDSRSPSIAINEKLFERLKTSYMKNVVIVLVYGSDRHKEQMRRLHNKILSICDIDLLFIGICEKNHDIRDIKINFFINPLREKYAIKKR